MSRPRTDEELLRDFAASGADVTCGACAEVFFTGVTTAAHTCPGYHPAVLVTLGQPATEPPIG